MAQTENSGNIITLHNTSDVPQHVFYNERRETIYPKTTRALPEGLAREFLAQRGNYVVIYRPIVVPNLEGAKKVYVANATGNPFLPEKVKVSRKHRGDWIEEEKPNPLRIPFLISERVGRGQTYQPVRLGDGDESLNHPAVMIQIPPFERVHLAAPFAYVLQERDNRRDHIWRGQVWVDCRGPSDPQFFEPNDSWSYEEVRLYARLMDKDTFEPLLINKFPEESSIKDKNKNNIFEKKKQLMDLLFFRCIDPKYPYPSREEFDFLLKKNVQTTNTTTSSRV